VRLFPRTARRRLVAAVAVGTLATGAVTVPLAYADDLKDRQKNVQKQIKQADNALEESSARYRRATARLAAAQADLRRAKGELDRARAKLTAARIRDQQMQAKLAAAEARLAQAKADLVNGREALAGQREVVADTIASIYEDGDPQILAFSSLLDAQDPADLTRRMEMNNVIVGNEDREYDALHAAEVLLEVREDQVEQVREEVAVQREAAADHLVEMKELTAAAQAARTRFHETVSARRGARQEALRARAADRRQLARLRAQEQRIKQLILEQARKEKGGYNGATGGFLNRPVPGYITSPYGYRTHPIYGYYSLHDGTDFHAACGSPMYAAAGGKVLSRYYSSVYGNRLVLGVGNVNGNYVSVIYNHATSYRVGVGQTIGRGEVIGYAGTTGWSTGCHLHFTVMVNGRTVNPMNWM
jgi:murein DD-endopeptidase MepM/ murein hydrolase activator NlpD